MFCRGLVGFFTTGLLALAATACGGSSQKATDALASDLLGSMARVQRCVGDFENKLESCADEVEEVTLLCLAITLESDLLLDETLKGADFKRFQDACAQWEIAGQSPRFIASSEIEKARQMVIKER
jgi:hypothetical protein